MRGMILRSDMTPYLALLDILFMTRSSEPVSVRISCHLLMLLMPLNLMNEAEKRGPSRFTPPLNCPPPPPFPVASAVVPRLDPRSKLTDQKWSQKSTRHRKQHRLGFHTQLLARVWCTVTKIEYFGTYLRYVPTNPTSRHCDNIPANPSWIIDISRYHLGHSTSSSTVGLVSFCLCSD